MATGPEHGIQTCTSEELSAAIDEFRVTRQQAGLDPDIIVDDGPIADILADYLGVDRRTPVLITSGRRQYSTVETSLRERVDSVPLQRRARRVAAVILHGVDLFMGAFMSDEQV